MEFAEPFPQWRSLFSPLLPSHLLKDSPGGWSSALDADLPLSGNRYKMTSYDPVTGQVSLARNDKYWAAPPGPSAVVLRLGRPPDLLAAFNRGDVQALWLAPDAATARDIADQVPAERRTVLATPSSLQVVMNAADGATADDGVRHAIAAALDPAAVAGALTAGWPDGGLTVTSQVSLPVDAGPGTTGAGRAARRSSPTTPRRPGPTWPPPAGPAAACTSPGTVRSCACGWATPAGLRASRPPLGSSSSSSGRPAWRSTCTRTPPRT